MKFSYVSYISTYGITTLHTQDIFLGNIKNHANNLIGDHKRSCPVQVPTSKWVPAVGALYKTSVYYYYYYTLPPTVYREWGRSSRGKGATPPHLPSLSVLPIQGQGRPGRLPRLSKGDLREGTGAFKLKIWYAEPTFFLKH